MTTPFAIAGIQMSVRHGQDNVPAMAQKLAVLLHRFPWVEMAVFSELAAFGASLEHAQTLPGPAEQAFQELARRHSIWLLPGSLFERVGEHIYNTTSVIAPDGTIVARYRKMFPFRPYEHGVTGGTEFVTFDVPQVGRFGVSICYDMWFPETTRTLVSMGAEVILHPSLTNTIDRGIELHIAQASAAMHQCFIFDINGVGDGGFGQSIVVRPTGKPIYIAGSSEELLPVDLNVEAARRARSHGLHGLGQTLKSFRDRLVQFPIYGNDPAMRTYLDSLGPLAVPQREARRRERAEGHP